MAFQFISDLEAWLAKEYPAAVLPAGWGIVPERCPEGMTGELVVNVFRIAKPFGCPPPVLAARVAEFLKSHPDLLHVEQIKAFVNVTLRPEAVYRDTVAKAGAILERGTLPGPEQRRILIEYSAPNTNKPQHLGHVRNNTLGMALASLLKRVGHAVTEINLVNDRGIHICKSMLAYQRSGSGETPESSGIKGDHLVGKYYVEFAKALSAELAALKAARPELAERSDEDLFLETELGRAAQKMLQDWEAGDPAVRALWQTMNNWVFAGFAQTYERFGIHFDHTYLESQTYMLGKDLIADGLARGVFERRDDGAVFADLGKLGRKVVLRSDGTSVYMTQDIGTTTLKYQDWRPEEQIWVVGDEQNLHFQMLFAILQKLGYEWADRLHHLSYGMVNLPTGKMKSREGTVVDADDLFDEMCELAYQSCKERAGEETDEAELRCRAEEIGLGALKFMLLKYNPKTTIMFDPQASIKFEGDTGPYVQYAVARIQSMLAKAAERGVDPAAPVDWSLLERPEEKSLAILADYYPATLQEAAAKLDCSVLVTYLLDLAKSFNRFYRECPVLTADDPALRRARLELALRIRDILSDGLRTLTIRIPAAM